MNLRRPRHGQRSPVGEHTITKLHLVVLCAIGEVNNDADIAMPHLFSLSQAKGGDLRRGNLQFESVRTGNTARRATTVCGTSLNSTKTLLPSCRMRHGVLLLQCVPLLLLFLRLLLLLLLHRWHLYWLPLLLLLLQALLHLLVEGHLCHRLRQLRVAVRPLNLQMPRPSGRTRQEWRRLRP